MGKKKKKPEMPDPAPVVNNTIPVTLSLDLDNYINGSMHITLGDTEVRMANSETGKEVGSVIGCIGSGTEIIIGKQHWFVSSKDLWIALNDVLENLNNPTDNVEQKSKG